MNREMLSKSFPLNRQLLPIRIVSVDPNKYHLILFRHTLNKEKMEILNQLLMSPLAIFD